jgi:transposase
MVGHYLFEPEFCNPAAGWEKGQVEKAVQDARHGLWYDTPPFKSLHELNVWLQERCQEFVARDGASTAQESLIGRVPQG